MLKRAFFAQPTLEVARNLIGCTLVHEIDGIQRSGRIVETEAYVGSEDAANHAHRGKTARTAPMFGPPGYAYVYLIYGMYHCLNIVTEKEGFPAAVLIRALEPGPRVAACHGPGRLSRAMGIGLSHNTIDITRPPLYLKPRQGAAPKILTTPRIGVAYAGAWAEKPWRFVDSKSSHLSVRVK